MKVLVEDKIIVTKFDEEIVLLNMENGKYFKLNETGVLIWEVLCESKDTEVAIEETLNQYDVDEATIRKDVELLIKQLIEAGLVSLA